MVFVHGSGSSRHRPCNRRVRGRAERRGPGTPLFDLLTREEEVDRAPVSGIGLLAGRLAKSFPADYLVQHFGVAPLQAHG